ncbi:hypothetical protein E1289_11630 [Actinomadura sp. 6K520]|nr:hypothetical protein E1289_11630 [Actinomadura sp. 6K520]
MERTLAWLFGYRRLRAGYERHGHLFNAFLVLAAAITCYKKLAELPDETRSLGESRVCAALRMLGR